MASKSIEKLESLIVSATSSSDAVQGAHLALRLMSHRESLFRRHISTTAFLKLDPSSTPSGRPLAQAIVREITKREQVPLHRIPEDRLGRYSHSISESVRRRLEREYKFDDERGKLLLEELRRDGIASGLRSNVA